jgi:hypothetical protein
MTPLISAFAALPAIPPLRNYLARVDNARVKSTACMYIVDEFSILANIPPK